MDMKEAPAKGLEIDVARLVQAHQAGLWRYLRALGCEPALAEDLTQDTFVSVLKKPFEQYNEAATAGYLRRVAHNLFISHQRRAGKVIAVDNLEEFENTWSEWVADDSGDELVSMLKECFTGLTERARLALSLRFRDKATRARIAEALEITEHGAKNLMQRAKKQLRECIEGKISE